MRYIDKRQLRRLVDLTDIDLAKAQIAALPADQRSDFIDANGDRWSKLKKDAAAGTNWKIDNKIVRVPYVGVDKDNLSQFTG
ncbi:hypothetical protein CQA86_22450, partial [Klebsiella pneumoniae]